MARPDAWLLALGLLELGAVVSQWLWLRWRIARLDDAHRALYADHQVLMQAHEAIRTTLATPSGHERVMAHMDLEVGDVVRELRDIRALLQRVLAERPAREAGYEDHAARR